LCLTLYWRALAPLEDQYTVFVHLVGSGGSMVAQSDSPPMSGLYPTTYWQEGQIVPDRHCLEVANELPEDRYLLEVGMYQPGTGKRLKVIDASGTPLDDRIVLGWVGVGAERSQAQELDHQVGVDLDGEVRLLVHELGGGHSG